MYYEAYSLYRSGGEDDLSTARDRLNELKQRYPAIAKNDGATLLTRVCGELAKRGDESCAADISSKAEGSDSNGSDTRGPGALSLRRTTTTTIDCSAQCADADGRRSRHAILQKVLARRDACSAGLRRKAVFLVSQKRTDQTANILMSVARSDPDQEVREQAVFWLSQGTRFDTAARGDSPGNGDENIKEKALSPSPSRTIPGRSRP